MDGKIKVLHFIYGLHIGGAETFIVNAIKNLDSSSFRFEFALQDGNVTNPTIRELMQNGRVKVHILPRFPSHIIAQSRALKRLLRENSYDVVHIHMNAILNPVPLLITCSQSLASGIIVHSHSSSNSTGGMIGKLIHFINSKLLIRESNENIACSDLAGIWMFGSRPYSVIDNAVDTSLYVYKPEQRYKIRKELNIDPDKQVIGSVGRFVYAKNHRFMLECFAAYAESHRDSILMLVGAGPMLEDMKTQANKLNIADKVIFTGLRTDIPDLLSAMDCFFFPSHFEGLGFTAIEAQATGLRVVASDTVPKEINQGNYVTFLPLGVDKEVWCDELERAIISTRGSDRIANPIKNSRFDNSVMIKKLDAIYKSQVKQ